VRRVSGPLLDRLDLRIEMARVRAADLLRSPDPEDSATVAARIARARRLALERNHGRLNAVLSGREALEACALSAGARVRLAEIGEVRAFSARAVHRVLRVARSIADLGGQESVDDASLLAAAELRDPVSSGLRSLAA
jgi:magnesium chelatase family protein